MASSLRPGRPPVHVPRLVGMVHLGPLPDAPAFDGSLDAVLEAAVADAVVLADTGFDAVTVENFGDAPFYADDVPKVTIASMTLAVAAIRAEISLPIGVNVLRNDALAALAIAAVTAAGFVRVNVLSGSMATDQGLITGRAAEVIRARDRLCPATGVFADVFVKHAAPPPGVRIGPAAQELAHRARADAVVVSGTATGDSPDLATILEVRQSIPDTPLIVGSGATPENVDEYLGIADSVIVGTSIKRDGVTTNPVDPKLAAELVAAAGG